VILDQHGTPFPGKSAARQYAEYLERAQRDTLWNLTLAIRNGWSHEEFRHWVETGEEP
jgi:hypothetical protein